MKSAAAVAHSPRQPFVVEEIDLPELHHTDVLVRIVAVGVCHTDIASRDGQLAAQFPAVFGHEGAGVVERIGSQVRKVGPACCCKGRQSGGFMEGNSIPDIFIPRMIELHAQGRFPFDKFVRYYPFHEINRAIEDQRNGSAIKPILEVGVA